MTEGYGTKSHITTTIRVLNWLYLPRWIIYRYKYLLWKGRYHQIDIIMGWTLKNIRTSFIKVFKKGRGSNSFICVFIDMASKQTPVSEPDLAHSPEHVTLPESIISILETKNTQYHCIISIKILLPQIYCWLRKKMRSRFLIYIT